MGGQGVYMCLSCSLAFHQEVYAISKRKDEEVNFFCSTFSLVVLQETICLLKSFLIFLKKEYIVYTLQAWDFRSILLTFLT